MVFPRGISITLETVEVGGSKSVVFCGQSTYKVSICCDRFFAFPRDIENPNYNVVLSQRIYLFLGSGRVALGAGQTLAACPDCVAEIRFLNEPGWVTVEADVGKCVRWKYRARAMQRSS